MAALLLVIAALLVAANGFFVAAEFAIVKVRSTRIEELARKGVRGAGLAQRLTRDLDAYLSATQLGITLASLGLGWIGEPAVADLLSGPLGFLSLSETALHSISLALAFALITAAHIVLGELAPKSIAILRPERTTLVVALPLRAFYLVFFPFIWTLNAIARALLRSVGLVTLGEGGEEQGHTEAELMLLVSRTKALTPQRARVVQKALSLESRTARHIMIPRAAVRSLPANMTLDAARTLALETSHGRFPVTETPGELDTAIGIVMLRDLLDARHRPDEVRVRQLARSAVYVPETSSPSRILETFHEQGAQTALVVDEHGGVAGIVTLADVVREILGPLPEDRGSRTSTFPVENSDRIDGSTPLRDLAELAGVELAGVQPVTVAGYLMRELGRFPRVGDKVNLGAHRLMVESIQGAKVSAVRVRPALPRRS